MSTVTESCGVSAADVLALEVGGVSKSFGGSRALNGVGLALRAGEVHGLLGENGSGKSTLIRVLAGYHAPDPGAKLAVAGRWARLPLRPGQARELGIAFVHQDLGLIPSLSVTENLRLGELAARRDWRVSWHHERLRAEAALGRFDVRLDPQLKVAELSPAERALLAIVRAAEDIRSSRVRPGVLVLDEPTVFLPELERRRLHALARGLAAEGAGVLFVSHDLDEVFELTDRVTVLRDGRAIETLATAGLEREALAELMTGKPLAVPTVRKRPPQSTEVSVAGLTGTFVRDLSFEVDAGEVLGLTGLLGSGFDEVPYLLFGAQRSRSGRLGLGRASFDVATMTPDRALRAGIALLPADRERDGCVGSLPVADNVLLPVLDRYRGPLGLRRRQMLHDAGRLLDRFGVQPGNPTLPFRELSGGNQQKVLLAKALTAAPLLLLLDGPTRGVDIGARGQILALIREATRKGTSIVCTSTDREELAAICDRVLVLAGGRVTGVEAP